MSAIITGVAKKTKSTNVKIGDIFSETQYYKVLKINGDDIDVVNDSGTVIELGKGYLDLCASADFVEKEQKVTRTELAEIFLAHPYTAMMVSFQKQVKQEDVLKEILDTYKNAAPKDVETAFKKSVNKALNGVERVATGRHHGGITDQGRVVFIDMDKDRGTKPDWDARTIQIDTRTLNWIIIKSIKYTLK